MTKQELIDHCLTLPFAYEDYPFAGQVRNSELILIRHNENKKVFASIYEKDDELRINLKCDPFEADFLRQTFEGISPAYQKIDFPWNQIIIGSDVPEDELFRQIGASYDLIKPNTRV
ncbi:MAG: MmcQ/YjbR family DNA-binding protein [Clostridiales bacterium]|jgi:predicted DNA-binding protein (MmcQ/YjbR family)|nr:MmcQ/YjbR family DNA-binding protein [Clostridiales bacterium]